MKNRFDINKKILEHCPNYYKIINTEFYENDLITEKLIKVYEEFVFSVDIKNKEALKKLENIDKILNKYCNDIHFKKELQKSIIEIKIKRDIKNVLEFIVDKILEIFERYTEGYTRNIYISRWI